MSFLERVGLWRSRVTVEVPGHVKVLLACIGVVLVLSIGVQLAYPRSEALPGARLNGQPVQGVTYDELVRRITTGFENFEVTVSAGELSETLPLGHLGAELEAEDMVRELTDYPLWQRAVPFSLLIKRPAVSHVSVSFSEEKLGVASESLSEALSVPAEDAKLVITDGTLTTSSARPGQAVRPDDLVELLKRHEYDFGVTSIAVAPRELSPAIHDDDIAPVRAQAEELIGRRIVIVAPSGAEFIPEPKDIASWLTIAVSEEGSPELQADQEQMAVYAERLNGSVGVKPGTVIATLLDGEEVSRTNATSGQAIAKDELIDGMIKVLFEAAPPQLAIRLVEVPPAVRYDRNYTSSEKGLRAFVDHVTKSEDVRIAVSQIGGKGWSARGRADEQTVAASTYKLYVASMLSEQIEKGALSWDSGIRGTDMAGCLERMIVVSDNPCAEELVERFGGTALNNHLYGKGLSRTTTFISREAAQTTAADLESMLRGIESGSIVGGEPRTRLLDAMGRQRYRAGVPAGSSGRVENKVGFLWEYLNDAAIVRHPQGTYAIAIMTKGSSWNRIAEITREIEQIMYS